MIRGLSPAEFLEFLSEIHDPSAKLRPWDELPNPANKLLIVVGSRKFTS